MDDGTTKIAEFCQQKLRFLAIKEKGEYCVMFTGLEMAHQDSALLRLQHKP